MKINSLKTKIFLLLFLFIVSIKSYAIDPTKYFGPNYVQNQANAKAVGNANGIQVNSVYGKKEGLNSKLIQPTMTGTPMTNFVGNETSTYVDSKTGATKSYAQVQCPNAKVFLQILFKPTNTGDFTATIFQDPKLSGNTSSYNTPLVSGVCSNGFISCDAGTWKNCNYYEWYWDGSAVGYTPVANTQVLGSCFCNNSSCGGNGLMTQANARSTFGAGLSSFLAAQTQMAISNVQAGEDAITLTYSGQDSQNCMYTMQSWTQSGYVNPNTINNDAALRNTGSAYYTQQTGQQTSYTINGKSYDADSPAYLVSNNEYMNTVQTEFKTCKISHLFSLTNAGALGCPAHSVPSGNMCIPDQTIWSNGYVTNNGGVEYCQVSAGIMRCGDPGHGINCPINLATVLSNPPQEYYCHFCDDDWCWTTYLDPRQPNNTATAHWIFTASHSHSSWATEPVILGCGQQCPAGYMLVNGGPNAGIVCLQISHVRSDSCKGQDFSKCKIKDEQVCDQNGQNCVYVYQNYQYVNPTIQPMCYTYKGPSSSLFNLCANGSSITYQDNIATLNTNYTACPGYTPYVSTQGTLDQVNDNSDWWNIKYTYDCPQEQEIKPDLSREQMIDTQGTYDDSAGAMTYPDVGLGAKNIQSYSGNNYQAKWSYTAPTSPCVYSCIVSINPPRTAVINAGTETTNNPSTKMPSAPSTIDKTYLACNQDPSTNKWTCPVDASQGEHIIQDCVCLDQGAQSIAIMSSMVSAAKDMICSQN
jgi:hypothetical protein